jgi:alpha-glucuronidase
VACAAASCRATLRYQGASGWYTLRVQYFDQMDGVSHFRLWIGKQLVDEWSADLVLPARKLDSTSSTRREISGVALRPGDEIRVEGVPDGGETAGLDYIEIVPER